MKFQCIVVSSSSVATALRACATVTQTPRRNANPLPMRCGGFRAYTSLRVRVPTTRHQHACARQTLARAFAQARARRNEARNARVNDETRACLPRAQNTTYNAVTCNNAQTTRNNADGASALCERREQPSERPRSTRTRSPSPTPRERARPKRRKARTPCVECGPGSPEQIRTAVTALRGRRPRPLDDGAGCRTIRVR